MSVVHSTICPGAPDPVPSAQLLAKLRHSALPSATKNEFETTSQFQSRVAKMAQAEFPNPTISVAVKVPPHRMTYDADKGVMTLEVGRSDYYVRRSNLLVTEIENIPQTLGYYEAQNAYGTTFEVEKQSVAEFVISWGEGPAPISGVKARTAVPPLEARELKEGAELVLAGTIVEPFLQRRRDLHLPTMDSPTRRAIDSYALFLTPSCIYLRNAKHKAYGLRILK